MKALASLVRRSRAYTTIPVVAAVSTVMLSGMVYVFRANNWSHDVQVRSQVKVDYSQKEEAILRALIHIVPNKSIGAMKDNSAYAADSYTWTKIFQEAINLAGAEESVSSAVLSRMGITPTTTNGIISANTADDNFDQVSELVTASVGTAALVNPGNTRETSLLFSTDFADKIPAPLASTSAEHTRDRLYPLVSLTKTHSSSWTKGLQLSPNNYPLYNIYQYPKIRFGYARPGDPFVAKRNWWTFSLRFGSGQGSLTLKKNYLLSIYEVPSQLPMSASGYMSVGAHADGTAWMHADLTGGVFAGRLETQGTVALPDGLFSARKSVNFSNATSVGGQAIRSDFDALGVREQREAQTGNTFYDASLAGNVGRVAFIPINRGQSFLELNTDGSASTRLSSTGWNAYTCGATQAKMRLEVRRMTSVNDQTPTEVRFHYYNTSGSLVTRTYTRGSNWPTDAQSGGTAIPFQTTTLDVGRRVLVVNLDRFPAFLSSISGAANATVNNSLYVYPNPAAHSSVRTPSIPSAATDMGVSLRGGRDLSAYSKGLSIVTNLRLYLAESLNNVAIATPSGSGLPTGTVFYPPISLFAPEKRFGETIAYENPVVFSGQVSSLSTSENTPFRPLDMKAGNEVDIAPDKIRANLREVRSPAELPPIHMMNWLVTVEEIH